MLHEVFPKTTCEFDAGETDVVATVAKTASQAGDDVLHAGGLESRNDHLDLHCDSCHWRSVPEEAGSVVAMGERASRYRS